MARGVTVPSVSSYLAFPPLPRKQFHAGLSENPFGSLETVMRFLLAKTATALFGNCLLGRLFLLHFP